MKLKITFFVLFTFTVLFVISCSSSKETGNTETKESASDSLYVFDEVPAGEVEHVNNPNVTTENQKIFLVQIGAFSTKDKAEEFVKMSKGKIQSDLKITYNKQVRLYTVRLANSYNSRSKAEQVRNELWKIKDFNDAWIVVQNK